MAETYAQIRARAAFNRWYMEFYYGFRYPVQ